VIAVAAWLSVALAAGDGDRPIELPPSDHTLVYYNARLALREGRSLEAVKLWWLRTALEDQTRTLSPHDADFTSITWAALGDLGVCADGLPLDRDGVGLWPLALHNWVVRNMGRRPKPARPNNFQAFEVSRQARLVSLSDVLSYDELKTVRLRKTPCLRPRTALLASGQPITAELSDRQVAGRLLRYLIQQARETLARPAVADRVRGRAALEARVFDLELQLVELAARAARREALAQAREGRVRGLTTESIDAMREQAEIYQFGDDTEPARILRGALDWPVAEWMTLSSERRRFLFDHVRDYSESHGHLDRTALGVIDTLLEAEEGAEVEAWIARHYASQQTASEREAIWGGARGQRLLALDDASGFQERSVIALHRGVDQLGRGDREDALRSFAFALQHARASRETDTVERLSRRWLSFVASQFVISDELLVTLQELVPRNDYAILLEDLLWRAAFRADAASYQSGLDRQLGRGAGTRRLEVLAPLARGDLGGFGRSLRERMTTSPSEGLRFLEQLLMRLELEEAPVRMAHLPTLAIVRQELERQALAPDSGSRGRRSGELLRRQQAIVEGLGGLGADASALERARSLAPGAEVFAGSVRLAPSDPLPWPFRPSEEDAPSVFAPLQLVPIEWRDPQGERVFGWKIEG